MAFTPKGHRQDRHAGADARRPHVRGVPIRGSRDRRTPGAGARRDAGETRADGGRAGAREHHRSDTALFLASLRNASLVSHDRYGETSPRAVTTRVVVGVTARRLQWTPRTRRHACSAPVQDVTCGVTAVGDCRGRRLCCQTALPGRSLATTSRGTMHVVSRPTSPMGHRWLSGAAASPPRDTTPLRPRMACRGQPVTKPTARTPPAAVPPRCRSTTTGGAPLDQPAARTSCRRRESSRRPPWGVDVDPGARPARPLAVDAPDVRRTSHTSTRAPRRGPRCWPGSGRGIGAVLGVGGRRRW